MGIIMMPWRTQRMKMRISRPVTIGEETLHSFFLSFPRTIHKLYTALYLILVQVRKETHRSEYLGLRVNSSFDNSCVCIFQHRERMNGELRIDPSWKRQATQQAET